MNLYTLKANINKEHSEMFISGKARKFKIISDSSKLLS